MTSVIQVRGKKNLVIEKALAGPVGIFVKFSTLQEYGVDKVFFLENDNLDSSQRNIIFLARGEDALHPQSIAGMYVQRSKISLFLFHTYPTKSLILYLFGNLATI